MNIKNKLRVVEMLLRNSNREVEVLLPLCQGKTVEIGCGYRKVHPENIGVDLCGKGELGKAGNVTGKPSQADYKSSGDDLHMFKDGEVDNIIAKHVLEHFEDPLKTLIEWHRVLRPGGKIGVVVPDDEFVDTLSQDPTHKHKFNLETLMELFIDVGFNVIEKGVAIPHWSIFIIVQKEGGTNES